MSENKFIKRLKGEQTAKSVLEIKNESAKTSFANMPQGTSNAIDVFSDHRGNATAVLNGTMNWKISNSNLILANDVAGDGTDFSSTYSVSGAGLWIDSVYTFPSTGDPAHPVAMVFNPSTKWVLKVCGDNLIVEGGYIADFTLLVKIGTSNIFAKSFSVAEQAGQFCKEFVLDFNETNAGIIKASGLSTLTVQLLCGTANASARIYNGMTVLTCLQRKVDASAVSNLTANVDDLLNAEMIPVEYFSNAEFIDQIEDGEQAYAVFERDGDSVDLAGWTPKDAVAYKDEVIIKAEVMPTPNADLVGAIYQYTGVTSAPYEHGYIYECVEQPENTLVFTPDIMSCDWDDLVVFLQNQTPNYNDIVKGSMTYNYGGDLWRFVGLDENDNVILSYQQYTQDWIDAGFEFTGTYQDGDVVTFVRNTTTIYSWERIDVQPSGSRGRFLALWNCATGLAESNPSYSPYEYKTGDYFIVGTVSTATPAVNYKPDGTSYVINQASTTVETNEVAVDDTYYYDGTTWKLQINTQKTTTFANIAGDPYNNFNLAAALNGKQDTLVSGTNIKTINNESILGTGNISINSAEWGNISGDIQDQTDLQNALDDKQDKFVAGRNLEFYYVSKNLFNQADSRVATEGVLQEDGSYYLSLASVIGIWTPSNIVSFNGELGTTYTISLKYKTNDTAIGVGFYYSDGTNDIGTRGGGDDNWHMSYVTSNPAKQVVGFGLAYGTNLPVYIKDIQIELGSTPTSYVSYYDGELTLGANVPTVGDGVVTFTQGGVTKGSISMNQGTNATIALDAGANYHPELLSHEWDDHERSDMNWVNALTFSWQNRADHQVAYDELASNISGKTLQSETISGTTVQFYLADNGRKICPDSQESNVAAIYTATGVAWYYIIDTTNQRFKLPRIDPVRKMIADSAVVKTSATEVYDPTGQEEMHIARTNGAAISAWWSLIARNTGGQNETALSNYYSGNVENNSGWAPTNLIADLKNATGSYFAGAKYLYFYVGSFTQTAIENTAGLNASLFNGKVDLDAQNLSAAGKEQVAHLAMPSGTYIDLTLGAALTTYTAPADGYMDFVKQGSNGEWIMLYNQNGFEVDGVIYNQGFARIFIPCKKGDTITVNYSASGSYSALRFYYANGAV